MISAAQFPLAFILLAHDNWPHLQQLVKYFAADPADTLVIHIDGRVPNVVFERVKQQLGRPNVLFSNRLKCHWGHFSLVEATLAGIQTLAASGRPFRYASLLSGVEHIPCSRVVARAQICNQVLDRLIRAAIPPAATG